MIKKYRVSITVVLLFVLAFSACKENTKEPELATQEPVNYLEESDEDFSKRMQWFNDAKYGMFIHFGLYSQLGGIYNGNEEGKYAEWIQANQQIPKSDYVKLLETWIPEKFDANKIAKLAKKAGMKYLVITTKHHEGFCLWDSKYTEYDIASTPMKGRDFIKELSNNQKLKDKFNLFVKLLKMNVLWGFKPCL